MSRQIALMIDGGFLTKRLPKLVADPAKLTPFATVGIIRTLCRAHVRRLTSDKATNWHSHVYRIFYYDAHPFTGLAHHPLTGKQINFGRSDRAAFQNELLRLLREQRNVALRLGHVSKLGGWTLPSRQTSRLLAARATFDKIDTAARAPDGSLVIPPELADEFARVADLWRALQPHEVKLDLRQKGVDMRIGLDIASIALKRLASTIVLVAGDADFVPAAKLARREGLQFILDPLWQSVPDDLFEHIDGLTTVLRRPGVRAAAEGADDAEPA